MIGSWIGHKSSLWDDLRSVRASGVLPDVEIVVGERTFVAHKCILYARCKGRQLDDILSAPEVKPGVSSYSLTNASPDHFATLLDFIYTEKCTLSGPLVLNAVLYHCL